MMAKAAIMVKRPALPLVFNPLKSRSIDRRNNPPRITLLFISILHFQPSDLSWHELQGHFIEISVINLAALWLV